MQKEKQTILTGDRPTGALHLGHFAGSLQNRVALQKEYNTFVLIADVQGLTDNFYQPELLQNYVFEVMLDYLAVGLDPEKVTFVLQSLIPEIHELAIYYLNLVTLTRALRNPTVKNEIREKREQQEKSRFFGKELDIPLGFLIYPVHQAADITAFDADLVPAGEDQLPMLEQTREIVRRMNTLYRKALLKEPVAKPGTFARVPGLDGKAKMGKSTNNAIYLRDDEPTINKAVSRMFTDPARIRANIPGRVEGNPLFIYHDAFNPDKGEVDDFKSRYLTGKVGDVEVKKSLARVLNNLLAPIRERRAYWAARLPQVKELLYDHSTTARHTTRRVLDRIRQAMKLKALYN